MSKLAPKQSLLDYLWVNFGERGVSNSSDSATQDSIPSYGLVQELVNTLSNKSVGSITLSGTKLIVKSINGALINSIDLKDLIPDTATIIDFGRRTVTQEDIDNGCGFLLYSPIYFIKFSDNTEIATRATNFKNSSTITHTFLDDCTVYSDLKISDNIKGVVFTKEEDGLSGLIYLLNSTRGLKFALVTHAWYKSSIHDLNTLYLIKNEPYMYFGDQKLANNSIEELTEIENRLTRLEHLISWEEHE